MSNFSLFKTDQSVYNMTSAHHLREKAYINFNTTDIYKDFHNLNFFINGKTPIINQKPLYQPSLYSVKIAEKETIETVWNQLLAQASEKDQSCFKALLNNHFHKQGISSVLSQALSHLSYDEKIPPLRIKNNYTNLQFIPSKNSLHIEERYNLETVEFSEKDWIKAKLAYEITFRENKKEGVFTPHITITALHFETNEPTLKAVFDNRTVLQRIRETIINCFKKIFGVAQDGNFLLKGNPYQIEASQKTNENTNQAIEEAFISLHL
jgi:hypothetical protein